jgi:hypothetical protein
LYDAAAATAAAAAAAARGSSGIDWKMNSGLRVHGQWKWQVLDKYGELWLGLEVFI